MYRIFSALLLLQALSYSDNFVEPEGLELVSSSTVELAVEFDPKLSNY